MISFGFALADTSPLSKADRHLFDEQTRMELLFAECPSIVIPRKNGHLDEVSKWPFVKLSTEGRVVQIHVPPPSYMYLGAFSQIEPRCSVQTQGTIDFQWLPENTQSFVLKGYDLAGSIETHTLPLPLTRMLVNQNVLRGTLDIQGLPTEMAALSVAINDFHGKLDLPALPKEMQIFLASRNRFCGVLDFSELPRAMLSLHLGGNHFVGKVFIPQLPDGFQSLHIENNTHLDDASVVIGSLPMGIRDIRIDWRFIGKVCSADGNLLGHESIVFC